MWRAYARSTTSSSRSEPPPAEARRGDLAGSTIRVTLPIAFEFDGLRSGSDGGRQGPADAVLGVQRGWIES